MFITTRKNKSIYSENEKTTEYTGLNTRYNVWRDNVRCRSTCETKKVLPLQLFQLTVHEKFYP